MKSCCDVGAAFWWRHVICTDIVWSHFWTSGLCHLLLLCYVISLSALMLLIS